MPHFKALMTTIYPTADLAKAKAWYAEAFGVPPYFDEPFYVGFNVAGYELGLHPEAPPVHVVGNGGAIAYWGVDDCAAAYSRFLALGAKSLAPVTDVGGGIQVATVADPEGNAIGLIENPHFEK